MDADDSFIGEYVFSVVNGLYHKYPQHWFIYSNYITLNKDNQLERGVSDDIPWKDLEYGYYRLSDKWVTSHLKTYRRDLYMKIDQKDWLADNGRTYEWASDRFIQYSLVELCG